MKRPFAAPILLSLAVLTCGYLIGAEKDVAPPEGPPTPRADPADVREEIEEEQRLAAEKRRQAAEANLREAVRLHDAEVQRKVDEASAAVQAANYRLGTVTVLKRNFDSIVSVNTNEIAYSNKKIANWNAELADLGSGSRLGAPNSGTSANLNFTAERKLLTDKIAAEVKRKQAAAGKIADANAQLALLNPEYNAAQIALRKVQADRLAIKPPATPPTSSAKAKPTKRTIYTLIDGRELSVIMAVENETDVRITTDDGKQFRFRKSEITDIRAEEK